MRRVILVVTALVAVVVLGACGGGAPESDRAVRRLGTEVAQVRAAVEAHDAAGAAQALATLRASVDRMQRSGAISAERTHAVLAAARGVEEQLVSVTATTTTTTTPVPPPTTKGRGKGDQGGEKGKGKD
jgi:hypothetical protein